MTTQNAKFEVGQIIVTPAAAAALAAVELTVDDLLSRHQAGDWGDVSAQVRSVNERGLVERFNLHSTYPIPDGKRLVVMTNRDRTLTMIHLDAHHR